MRLTAVADHVAPAAGAALSLPAAAADSPRAAGLTARSMDAVFSQARAFAAKGRRVAVIFDIDSTLLAARQDLGSTPWLGEQASALNERARFLLGPDRALAGEHPALLRDAPRSREAGHPSVGPHDPVIMVE